MASQSTFDSNSGGTQSGGAAPASLFRPLFVVGCERSGTTLLAVMVGRHSEIAMTPETHFFLRVVPRCGWSGGEREGDHAAMVERLFNSPRGGDLGLERGEVLARFSSGAATYPRLFEVVMAIYAENHGKVRAAEKTPFHLYKVPLILEWFPEARVVGLVRDGRDTVLSILNAPWTAHRSMRRQSDKWNHAAREALRLRKRYPEKFLLIRYEDLVAEPEKTMREVDGFLGLAFEAGQLESGEKRTDVVPERELKWKGNVTAAPDKSRVGAWVKKVTAEERLVMNTMMGKYLRHFGYPDTEVRGVSMGKRVVNGVANVLCRMQLYRLWYNVVGRHSRTARRHRMHGGSE